MTCARGDHVAPRTGGTCPCGLVTYVPAPAKPLCPTCLGTAFVAFTDEATEWAELTAPAASELAEEPTR